MSVKLGNYYRRQHVRDTENNNDTDSMVTDGTDGMDGVPRQQPQNAIGICRVCFCPVMYEELVIIEEGTGIMHTECYGMP